MEGDVVRNGQAVSAPRPVEIRQPLRTARRDRQPCTLRRARRAREGERDRGDARAMHEALEREVAEGGGRGRSKGDIVRVRT